MLSGTRFRYRIPIETGTGKKPGGGGKPLESIRMNSWPLIVRRGAHYWTVD